MKKASPRLGENHYKAPIWQRTTKSSQNFKTQEGFRQFTKEYKQMVVAQLYEFVKSYNES